MTDTTQRITEEEEYVRNHREHNKALNELTLSRQRSMFDEFKLKYENKNSTVDYILDLVRQFLYIGATGYLGLLVVPSDILGNVALAQKILLLVVIICPIVIFLALLYKIGLAAELDAIVNNRIEVYNLLFKNERECETFCQKQLERITKNKRGAPEKQ